MAYLVVCFPLKTFNSKIFYRNRLYSKCNIRKRMHQNRYSLHEHVFFPQLHVVIRITNTVIVVIKKEACSTVFRLFRRPGVIGLVFVVDRRPSSVFVSLQICQFEMLRQLILKRDFLKEKMLIRCSHTVTSKFKVYCYIWYKLRYSFSAISLYLLFLFFNIRLRNNWINFQDWKIILTSWYTFFMTSHPVLW